MLYGKLQTEKKSHRNEADFFKCRAISTAFIGDIA